MAVGLCISVILTYVIIVFKQKKPLFNADPHQKGQEVIMSGWIVVAIINILQLFATSKKGAEKGQDGENMTISYDI